MLFIAAWLRFHALAQEARFQPDEALFATFARNAAVQGDWLLHGALDKTPLTIYASAVSMTLVGVTSLPNGVLTLESRAGEFAARVPNVFASILLVAAMGALAKRLYPKDVGTRSIVSLLVALSPFALAFSATAFTDGLMLLFIVLSLWLAAARRPLWAGVWLALGFAGKQQALLYAPLVLLVGWGVGVSKRESIGEGLRPSPTPALFRSAALFSLPLIVVFLLLLIAWDAARGQSVSLWALAAANNDPGRLIRADEVLPRLAQWVSYGQWFAGYGWLTAVLTIFAALTFLRRLVRQPRRRETLFDALLLAYLLAYFLLHWVVAFNTYDRYLLPLLPVTLLLLARGLDWILPVGTRSIVSLQMLLLIIGLLGVLPALDAAKGRIPIGGDRGQHDGIDALAAYLNQKPLGTIIYDHWLGWELGYYLGVWSDKRRVYHSTPAALAADARLQPDPAPRYFPVPAGQPVQPWLDALRAAGFGVSLVYDDGRFHVYELTRP
ncbi:MAG: hypothetical protein HZC41_01430 [Chloroflexi bacterium]|nr:hypothetical protein [Chloroflexota bacterium]